MKQTSLDRYFEAKKILKDRENSLLRVSKSGVLTADMIDLLGDVIVSKRIENTSIQVKWRYGMSDLDG